MALGFQGTADRISARCIFPGVTDEHLMSHGSYLIFSKYGEGLGTRMIECPTFGCGSRVCIQLCLAVWAGIFAILYRMTYKLCLVRTKDRERPKAASPSGDSRLLS